MTSGKFVARPEWSYESNKFSSQDKIFMTQYKQNIPLL